MREVAVGDSACPRRPGRCLRRSELRRSSTARRHERPAAARLVFRSPRRSRRARVSYDEAHALAVRGARRSFARSVAARCADAPRSPFADALGIRERVRRRSSQGRAGVPVWRSVIEQALAGDARRALRTSWRRRGTDDRGGPPRLGPADDGRRGRAAEGRRPARARARRSTARSTRRPTSRRSRARSPALRASRRRRARSGRSCRRCSRRSRRRRRRARRGGRRSRG